MLDSNQYIFAFGPRRKPSCELLLDKILETSEQHTIRITRMIIEEVRRNVSPIAFKEFMGFIQSITEINEDFCVPFEIGSTYEARGLKPADAFIGAYTHWVGADILISENRHFLTRQKELPFDILNAASCIKLL